MRTVFLVIILLLSNMAFGQTSVETSELHNGALTKKRTEKGAHGEVLKEIYYYPDNKVQIAYFLQNGKRIRWVSYDKDGVKDAEWNDPEIENDKRLQLRAYSFIGTLTISLLFFWIFKKLWSYRVSYYLLIVSSALIFTLSLQSSNRTISSSVILEFAIASLIIVLPLLLLMMSVFNLITQAHTITIPKLLSVFCILTCFILLLYILVAASVAGAGMLA